MLVAFRWLKANHCLIGSPPICVLACDSEYAAAAARGHSKLRANASLVLALRRAYSVVPCAIQFRKALAHSGLILNEHADRLAAAGAAGLMVGGFESLVVADRSSAF